MYRTHVEKMEDVLGEVLVHHGPLRALVRDEVTRRDVAARRVQRRWRSTCIHAGKFVRWKFRRACLWETGYATIVMGHLCIARRTPKSSYIFLPHPGVVWKVSK